MLGLKDFLKELRLIHAFTQNAKISADGKTITLAGYTARRNDSLTLLPFGLKPSWDITAPPQTKSECSGVSAPANRIVCDEGVFSRRAAITIMARHAAANLSRLIVDF
jgi:hypothetical protein